MYDNQMALPYSHLILYISLRQRRKLTPNNIGKSSTSSSSCFSRLSMTFFPFLELNSFCLLVMLVISCLVTFYVCDGIIYATICYISLPCLLSFDLMELIPNIFQSYNPQFVLSQQFINEIDNKIGLGIFPSSCMRE